MSKIACITKNCPYYNEEVDIDNCDKEYVAIDDGQCVHFLVAFKQGRVKENES